MTGGAERPTKVERRTVGRVRPAINACGVSWGFTAGNDWHLFVDHQATRPPTRAQLENHAIVHGRNLFVEVGGGGRDMCCQAQFDETRGQSERFLSAIERKTTCNICGLAHETLSADRGHQKVNQKVTKYIYIHVTPSAGMRMA
ncbi:unnamed protein product [Ectocarpus sp. 12 AP-2014]